MKKHLLLLFAALLPLVASAEKVEIDGIWYNLVSKAKQAEVIRSDGDKYSGSITIPATVTHNGVAYSVTSIGRGAFSSSNRLTSITIPEGVTSIGSSAFNGCSRLASITIPESVKNIGNGAFYDCSGITTITIPENSQLTSIEDNAFRGCRSLESITIPEGVTSIGNTIFSGCNSLVSIILPENVTSIGSSAFNGCSSLASITIPESVTSIGSYAFACCSSLTSITIPKNVKNSIKIYTFYSCSSLTSITLPDAIKSIEYNAFCGCSSLTSITLPESVTSIEKSAFYGCTSLTSITIPEKVIEIKEQAFFGCNSLTSIVLSNNIEEIYSEAFANCSELLDVYCYTENVPYTATNAFDGSSIADATLHVFTSALENYKATVPWSNFGKFETTNIAVSNITLNTSSVALTEGDCLTLTAIVSPDDATDSSVIWSSSNSSIAAVDNTGKVTAISPGTATITATANDGSGVSASCEVTVQELILGKCATPTISYVDGKVVLTCETEGAKVITTIAKGDDETREDMEFEYIPAQTLTAYATKEKYEDSDEVTLTLCWIPCEENHEESDGIVTIPSKPVLISARDGVLTLSGLAEGTEVAVYTANGTELATATATNGTATLATNLTAGTIAIVKIGEHSIKVAIR